MPTPRPVNLNLLTIRFPVMAIVSILHRVSGVLVFLSLPFLFWLLDFSLESAEAFEDIQQFLAGPMVKIVLWLILSATMYHVLAGIRHLCMDYGWFGSLQAARRSAYVMLALFALTVVAMGIWLWQ